MAENLLRGTGKELVTFRCTHIIGPPESPGPLAQSMLAKPGKKVGILVRENNGLPLSTWPTSFGH